MTTEQQPRNALSTSARVDAVHFKEPYAGRSHPHDQVHVTREGQRGLRPGPSGAHAMKIDETALKILDLKVARINSLGLGRDAVEELPGILQWILSVPILRSYVKEIVRVNEKEVSSIEGIIARGVPLLAAAGVTLRAAVPQWDTLVSPPFRLDGFERAQRGATSPTSDADVRRQACLEMADMLEKVAQYAMQRAVEQRRHEEVREVVDGVLATARPVWHDIVEIVRRQQRSAYQSLVKLIDTCRALHPPLEGRPHWTDLVPVDRWQVVADRDVMESTLGGPRTADYVKRIHQALHRFVEELHVLGTSTLSHRTLVESFKERCTWYDKSRMRQVASGDGGTREDRLTLELAKYLHDNGIFVLVRPRVSNLEPDVVALRGLAVEAKAYSDAKGARSDILHGFYQLHAYMNSLDTVAMRVTEGFLVAFRLGGPIYELPAAIDTGRFVIHAMTVDLGESSDSGRQQPQTAKIRNDEIFSALEAGAAPGHGIARRRVGFSHGTTRMPSSSGRTRWPSIVKKMPR